VQDGAFDCITLDLSLGDHAGAEMLKHLWGMSCNTPIIIISGCDDATCSESEKFAGSLKLNLWESIPKPVNMAGLRDSLERLKAARASALQAPQIAPP
jgi:two-component system, chemotaxis family, chemotaxis protein CheY